MVCVDYYMYIGRDVKHHIVSVYIIRVIRC